MKLFQKRVCFSVPTYTDSSGVIKIQLPISVKPPINKLPCNSPTDTNLGWKIPVVTTPGIEPTDPCTTQLVDQPVPQQSDYSTSLVVTDIAGNISGSVTFINNLQESRSTLVTELNSSKTASKMKVLISNRQLSNVRLVDNFILYDDLKNVNNVTNSSVRIHPSFSTKPDYFSYIIRTQLSLWEIFSKYDLTGFQNIINLRKDFGENVVQIDKASVNNVTFSDLLTSDLIQENLDSIQLTTSITLDELVKYKIRSFIGSNITLNQNVQEQSTYIAILVSDIVSLVTPTYLTTVVDNVIVQNLLATDDSYIMLDGYIATDYTTDYVFNYQERNNNTPIVVTGNTVNEVIRNISTITSTPVERIKYVHYNYKYLPIEKNIVTDTTSERFKLYSLTQLIISRRKQQKFWLVLKVTPKQNTTRTVTTRDIINNLILIFTNIYSKMLSIRVLPITDDQITICKE